MKDTRIPCRFDGYRGHKTNLWCVVEAIESWIMGVCPRCEHDRPSHEEWCVFAGKTTPPPPQAQ